MYSIGYYFQVQHSVAFLRIVEGWRFTRNARWQFYV